MRLLKFGTVMLICCSFLLFFRDTSSSAICSGPTINSCSGDPCQYVHIYDKDGNFINESSGPAGGYIYWNGSDCSGNPVPCGKYTLKIYYVSSGGSSMITDYIMVAGDSATT